MHEKKVDPVIQDTYLKDLKTKLGDFVRDVRDKNVKTTLPTAYRHVRYL